MVCQVYQFCAACSEVSVLLQVHPDLSRQLLQDGYRLDEIPDDEDLDLIPPKAMGSSACCCCCEQPSCSVQWLLGVGPNEDSALTSAGFSCRYRTTFIPAQLLRAAWGRPAVNAGAHSAPKQTQVDMRASLTHCDSEDQVLFNPLRFCSFTLNSSSE